MHNIEVLVNGKDRCTLQMHPDDASRLGVEKDSKVLVTSRVGSLEAPVEITDAIRDYTETKLSRAINTTLSLQRAQG